MIVARHEVPEALLSLRDKSHPRGDACREPLNIARHAGKQRRIGFQPVSGRAARHPQKSVVHGTGTVWKQAVASGT
jgi:hypothetical protein